MQEEKNNEDMNQGKVEKQPEQSPQAAPTVKAPDQSKAILVLILNIVLPGVGTIIYGETTRGVIQLAIYIAGFILTFIVVGFFLIVGAWIWALVDGINYYKILSKA